MYSQKRLRLLDSVCKLVLMSVIASNVMLTPGLFETIHSALPTLVALMSCIISTSETVASDEFGTNNPSQGVVLSAS